MIPSLLQIPSAVSDSKLHSVLPNNGKGDFTFDRSTGATRINKDGLIEEVGYFSSELVQNGNFSELGSELIVNGDFATTDNWNAQPSWSINNGKAVAELASNRYIQQNFTGGDLTSGKTYKIVFTVSDYITGNLKAQLGGGGSTQDVATINANGTYTYYAVATNNATNLRFKGISSGGGFTGKIDNVSVKQVDPNDRWSLGTGWSYGDGVAISTTAQTNLTCNSATLEIGKTYKFKVDAAAISSGSFGFLLRFNTTNTNIGTINADGSYSFIATADATSFRLQTLSGGSTSFSVDNVSVVEVQGDRPRLSYDITNGVVEDKPHLLLEPSSSNVVVNSKQTNTWTYTEFGSGSAGTITTGFTDMMGETNAIKVDYPANADNAVVRFGSTTDSLTSGTATYSMYIKLVEAGSKVLQIRASTGILQTITVNSTEFKRYSVTGTKNSNEAISLIVRPAQGTSSGGFSVVVCCPQGEAQSYATSYIPTAGTTITRAAETCNNSKPSVNSTEGVLYAEIAALADDSTDRRITISDGTTNNRLCIGFDNASNKIKYFLTASSSSQASADVSVSDITQFNKIAFKFKANDFELYMNGSVIASDTSGSTSSANTLDVIKFAGYTGTTQEFYGKVKGLAVYNEALSESQLMQLTGVTASSIYSNFVTRTASFTVEALNEVKKVIDNL